MALLTDARFSGVAQARASAMVSPEALAGGPIGKVRDGDRIRSSLTASGWKEASI